MIAEPIAPVLGSDLGDVAKQVDRAVSDALHALSFHRDCMNALVVGDYARALAAAQQGLKIRPSSAAINQCVLSTLRATHAAPDSIIAVARAITAVDSTNAVAWANLTDAYRQKGDSTRALDAERVLHRLDPTNADITADLIDRIVNAGQPQAALALIDSALSAAPDSPTLLRKKWLLEVRLGQYAAALKSGAALIAADSSAATVDYFERQLAVAKAANDSAAAHRVATEGSARFPKNANFLLTLARSAVDQGASREALVLLERVIAVEPANSVAWQLAIAAHAKTNGADSAVAMARRALTAGVDKDAIGTSLLAIVRPTLATAQASQKRGDWEVVLHTAQAVDSVASTPSTNYYVGIAAYQVAADELQGLSAFATKRTPTRAERQTACASSTRAEGLLGTVTMALPKGGSVDPGTAGKVLSALPAMSEFVASVKQASCRAKDDE